MTSPTVPTPTAHAVLRDAAERARLAPSVHNTQPWRFGLHGDVLELHADPSRQLAVIDPTGRQLAISCGCALFNARASLAAAGYQAEVTEFPDPARPDLLARVTLGARSHVWLPLAGLDGPIERRRSNRREYFGDPVAVEFRAQLVQAAAAEQAELRDLADLEQRILASRLTREATEQQLLDPAYRAEIRAWTSDDPRRPDGVQAMSVPRVAEGTDDELPLRDFDSHGMGWLPTRTHSAASQHLLLLCTARDTRPDWLHAGQALERLWLEATRQGYAISLFTQAIEHPASRARLRAVLGLAGYPHVLVRVGRAPATPASRRRELANLMLD
ncbi:MAG TPA: hypothetical protein VMB79_06335 [Jatrophihabitans sp.]|nr:hypothetical protein [Jatrophihabitans sp.]